MQDETINLEDYTKSDWTILCDDQMITSFTTHEGSKLIIGSSPDADVVIDNPAISGHCFSLELRDGRHYLAELEVSNGITVNGKKITSKVVVTEKDVISIGKFSLLEKAADEQHAALPKITAMAIGDDATAFATSLHPQAAIQPSQATLPAADEIYGLTVIEGEAAPNTLSLAGKNRIKIGQDPASDLIIPGWFVGKTQCYVVSKKDKYYIVPQLSWANTRLNDVIIKGERLLRKGDTIQIKNVKIRFS
ncbi:MAG: FHA domain-containing protein [Desulfurivibrionaceae bacterium]